METSLTTTEQRHMGLTPQTIDEALRMADIMAKASIIPKDYQGNSGNILVAIQWGAELGLPPLQAMQSIAVINGRPSLWGDAVIGLVRGSGLLESIHEEVTDTQATCTVKRRGEDPAERHFTMEDAKRAGLLGKPGPWSQYPKRMLQMRARAWALRDVFPDVLRGVSVAEEAQDIPPERNMGPAEVIPSQPTTSRTEAIKAKLKIHTAPPVEVISDLDRVLALISEASNNEQLGIAATEAGKLTNAADKRQARAAYKARIDAMRAEDEAEAQAERDAMQEDSDA